MIVARRVYLLVSVARLSVFFCLSCVVRCCDCMVLVVGCSLLLCVVRWLLFVAVRCFCAVCFVVLCVL